MEPERRLEDVLLRYLEAAERGVEPDVEQLGADSPDLAREVREFVDTHRYLERLTDPVRYVVRHAGPPA